ncbi:MAG: TOBE domain-containing protein [Propionibacterium sp.]|nr:TOBE domain-containing protein [Propionibacterium sp.]
MKLSTRNQLAGTIVSIAMGEAMASVKVRLDGTDQVLTSAITADAANDLGLAEGQAVTLLIKATDVAVAID